MGYATAPGGPLETHLNGTYVKASKMRRDIGQIILKIASRCNLNCSYCYVYNHEDTGFITRPTMISDDVFDAILERIKEYCERREAHDFTIAFHGGEPTLVGVERFRELVIRAKRVLKHNLSSIALQTNGTLIDEQWAKMIIEHRIAANVSLDGPAHIHDASRVDHAGRGSYVATVRGIKVLQDFGISPTVLCVVNPRESGAEVYRFFRSLNITSMDFLLPDVSHDNKERMYAGLGETPVADYLIPVLDAWLDEDNPDVSVRIFRGLFRRLFGGPGLTDDFGNTGSSYLIVETNGSIEANDALRVCEDGIARSGLNVLYHGFDDLNMGLPLVYKAVNGGFPLPTACRECPERDVCGGGYLPHRYSKKNGFDNPSVWCSDIIQILRHMRQYLQAEGLVTIPTLAS
jgi:uncharacterized protein